jgi:hypothetical protein
MSLFFFQTKESRSRKKRNSQLCWTAPTLPSENRVSHRVGRAGRGGIEVTAAGSWKFPLVKWRGQMQVHFRAFNGNSAEDGCVVLAAGLSVVT